MPLSAIRAYGQSPIIGILANRLIYRYNAPNLLRSRTKYMKHLNGGPENNRCNFIQLFSIMRINIDFTIVLLIYSHWIFFTSEGESGTNVLL